MEPRKRRKRRRRRIQVVPCKLVQTPRGLIDERYCPPPPPSPVASPETRDDTGSETASDHMAAKTHSSPTRSSSSSSPYVASKHGGIVDDTIVPTGSTAASASPRSSSGSSSESSYLSNSSSESPLARPPAERKLPRPVQREPATVGRDILAPARGDKPRRKHTTIDLRDVRRTIRTRKPLPPIADEGEDEDASLLIVPSIPIFRPSLHKIVDNISVQQFRKRTDEKSKRAVVAIIKRMGLHVLEVDFQLYGKQIFFAERTDLGESAHARRRVLKLLYLESMQARTQDEAMEKAVREVTMYQRSASCPFIIDMFQFEFDPASGAFLVELEYTAKGDLCRLLMELSKGLAENKARCIFVQLVKGVVFLHKHGIAHRDIKLDNALIFGDRVKLCDLGEACDVTNIRGNRDRMAVAGTLCGTVDYLSYTMVMANSPHGKHSAPDKWACDRDLPWNPKKSDVWALGLVLFALLNGYTPYDAKDDMDPWCMIDAIQNTRLHLSRRKEEGSADELIASMLEWNEQKRFGIMQVFKHPWLKEPRSKTTQCLQLSAQDNAGARSPDSTLRGHAHYRSKLLW